MFLFPLAKRRLLGHYFWTPASASTPSSLFWEKTQPSEGSLTKPSVLGNVRLSIPSHSLHLYVVLSFCVSVYMLACLSPSRFLILSACLSASIYMPICLLPTCLSLSISLPVSSSLSVYVPLYFSRHLCACMSLC